MYIHHHHHRHQQYSNREYPPPLPPPLCGIFAKVQVSVQSDYRQVSVMTSLGKEIFDSRILGRGRHQIVQDYPVSYSGIEEVVAAQVHRDALKKFYLWEHGLLDDVVDGLPSLVQPNDSLRCWRHLGPSFVAVL
jgi:hypothetical protein